MKRWRIGQTLGKQRRPEPDARDASPRTDAATDGRWLMRVYAAGGFATDAITPPLPLRKLHRARVALDREPARRW